MRVTNEICFTRKFHFGKFSPSKVNPCRNFFFTKFSENFQKKKEIFSILPNSENWAKITLIHQTGVRYIL